MADDNPFPQPVDYAQMAKQQAAGLHDAGFFDSIEGALEKGLTSSVGKLVNWMFSGLDALIVLAAKAIFAILGDLDPAFGTIASLVVGNLFDVSVDTSIFTNLYDGASRKAVSEAVGANLLKAFKGDQANAGAGELQPSTAAAETYLGVMANLAIEGWTFNTLGGMVPFLHLDHLGALNEEMARVLGLGRMSRAVLRPFVNTLIATPALWSVNKQYRPKMLAVPEAIRAVLAGTLDEATMQEIAARDGLGDDAIAILLEHERKRFSAADLDLLVRMQLKDRDWALEQLRATGLDAQEANDRLVLEDAKSLRTFQLAVANRAIAAYGEHKIDELTLADEIDHLGLDQTTLDRLHADALHRRAAGVLHMSRGDVESAVENDVLGITDYRAWLHARGYADDDALTLELLLLAKLQKLDDAKHARELASAQRAADRAAKLQAQQAKRDQVAGEHAHWTGTLGEAERLVVRNIMPPSQYRQVLVDHGLSAGDADALTAVAVADRDARAAAARKRAELAGKVKAPAAPIAALEHAVLLGARSIDDLRAELIDRNYAADDVQMLVDLVTRELADRQAQQAKRDALAAGVTGKAIALAQLEAAVVAGAASIDQYRARLVAAKYSATDVATLVALLQVKLKDHAFALERRALAEQKLDASHVSLANEEKAVVDGILTLADYQLWLTSHDFDTSDVAIMTALLEEKLAKKAGLP